MSFHVPGNQPSSRHDHSRRLRTCSVTLEVGSKLLVLGLGPEPREAWDIARRLPSEHAAAIAQVVQHVVTLGLWERCVVLCPVNQRAKMRSGTSCPGVVPAYPTGLGLDWLWACCHALVTRLLVSWSPVSRRSTSWSTLLLYALSLASPALDSSSGKYIAHGDNVAVDVRRWG
ncbi:hypothetical protein J3F83DRAFT_716915 [Trichoderma novae-zelandiae]